MTATRKPLIAVVAIIVWSFACLYLGTRYQAMVFSRQEEKNKALIPDPSKLTVSSGIVTKVQDAVIEISDLRDQTKQFTTSASTSYIMNGQPTSLDSVKPGDTVRIIPEQSDASVARQVLIVR